MEINDLIWRLFLILLPGVVSTLMLRYITTNKKYTIFEFIIYSATMGMGTIVMMELFYSLYSIIISIFSAKYFLTWGLNLSIWDNLLDGEKSLNKLELFFLYILAIPMGFLWGFLITKKIIIKIFQRLKLTNRYGDNDVWSFFLTSPSTDWVLLRDKREKLTYFGKVSVYSDSTEIREILLQDVIVYTTDTWEELYKSDAVYLELNNFDFTIESPKSIENEDNNN